MKTRGCGNNSTQRDGKSRNWSMSLADCGMLWVKASLEAVSFSSGTALEIWADGSTLSPNSTTISFRPAGNGGKPQYLHHSAHRDLLALPTPTIDEHAQPQQSKLQPDHWGLPLTRRPTPLAAWAASPHADTALAVSAAQLPACEQLPRGGHLFHAFTLFAWFDLDDGSV